MRTRRSPPTRPNGWTWSPSTPRTAPPGRPRCCTTASPTRRPLCCWARAAARPSPGRDRWGWEEGGGRGRGGGQRAGGLADGLGRDRRGRAAEGQGGGGGVVTGLILVSGRDSSRERLVSSLSSSLSQYGVHSGGAGGSRPRGVHRHRAGPVVGRVRCVVGVCVCVCVWRGGGAEKEATGDGGTTLNLFTPFSSHFHHALFLSFPLQELPDQQEVPGGPDGCHHGRRRGGRVREGDGAAAVHGGEQGEGEKKEGGWG